MQYEDMYVCIDIFKQVKFVKIIPRTNYNYRMRENSIVNTKSKRNIFDFINSTVKQENDLVEYNDLHSKAKIITFLGVLSLAVARAKGIIDLDAAEEKNLRNTIREGWKKLPLKFWKAHIKAGLYLYCPTLLKYLATLNSYRQMKYKIYEK